MRLFKPEGGECYVDVFDRAKQFLEKVVAENLIENDDQFQKGDNKKPKVLAVTHRGFIMELMNVVHYINDQTEPIYKEISGNCSVTILRLSQKENTSYTSL